MYSQAIQRMIAMGISLLLHPSVIIPQNESGKTPLFKRQDFRTGSLTKKSKSIPGKVHCESPMYQLKIPKTQDDLNRIDAAQARQIERGDYRRRQYWLSLVNNPTVILKLRSSFLYEPYN